MSDNSFDKINYYLRPNKQVERKILIDILLHFRKYIDLNNFSYVGMGSIYYYDFVMIHRFLGLKNLFSFDSASSVKRFEFNKPYDFITFKPNISTDYLASHPWDKTNTITWLDYDGNFYDNIESIINDIKILAKNCVNHDLAFLTINCFAPKGKAKKEFIETYKRFISPAYQDIEWITNEKFQYVIQNIMNNVFISENLHSGNKYSKICSFLYRDGAPMFTLGGFFTSDELLLSDVGSMHDYISFDAEHIHNIIVPNVTYKEKHYLDNNIVKIKEWVDQYTAKVQKEEADNTLHDEKIQKLLNDKMDFELTTQQINNYLKHSRFMPQYFEGLI